MVKRVKADLPTLADSNTAQLIPLIRQRKKARAKRKRRDAKRSKKFSRFNRSIPLAIPQADNRKPYRVLCTYSRGIDTTDFEFDSDYFGDEIKSVSEAKARVAHRLSNWIRKRLNRRKRVLFELNLSDARVDRKARTITIYPSVTFENYAFGETCQIKASLPSNEIQNPDAGTKLEKACKRS